MSSGYQTLPGKFEGLFPTYEWFKKINKHVDFTGKSVVDFGCCDGVLSYFAKQAGAKKVIGIDNEEEKIEIAKTLDPDINWVCQDIKLARFDHYDIKIFSMIIHWLGKEETLRQIQYANTLIFIYRQKNDAYDHPDNGQWFPSQEELDKELKDFHNIHIEVLMEQDNHKKIVLSIYAKKSK